MFCAFLGGIVKSMRWKCFPEVRFFVFLCIFLIAWDRLLVTVQSIALKYILKRWPIRTVFAERDVKSHLLTHFKGLSVQILAIFMIGVMFSAADVYRGVDASDVVPIIAIVVPLAVLLTICVILLIIQYVRIRRLKQIGQSLYFVSLCAPLASIFCESWGGVASGVEHGVLPSKVS